MTDQLKPKRALLSVSDKTGLIEFAKSLSELGVEILSTGGTRKALIEAGIDAISVSDITQFPEIMAGRVKTLHPKIHGGILARRGVDDAIMREHDIHPIDLVVINLYPFQQTIARDNCTIEDAIENIDIGGPAMVRAAAKNHKDVAIIVNPKRYEQVIDALKAGGITSELRRSLAVEAFGHTSRYDAAVYQYLDNENTNAEQAPLAPVLSVDAHLKTHLRYGENPHQRAALYVDAIAKPGTLTSAKQLQGKELSWNNINDANAALECVSAFDSTACVIVKHANPCGVAVKASVYDAYQDAYKCDPVSAFGGIIAFNSEVDAKTAEAMVKQQFIEVVIAPSYEEAALNVFASKKNVRLLETDAPTQKKAELDVRRIGGGWLVQDDDQGSITERDLQIVTKIAPTATQIADMLMAWKVVKYVKSNAIIYVHNQATVGIGAGQMSRVHSAQIAGIKAAESGLTVEGAVMASDAFFPFRDGIDAAAERGIKAIIQPGSSMRDDEVIAAANEHEIAMVFTNMRHFRH